MTELVHDCPKSGFTCPDCEEQEKLAYRIKQDEYVCGACGLVSTVNEVVAHSQERGMMGNGTTSEEITFDTIDNLRKSIKFQSNITLRPMGDRVLIRPLEDKKVTDSGLHIPGNATPEAGAKRGMVLAVGKGDKLDNGERREMFCRPGDRVFYRANPNQEFEMEFEDGKKDKCAVINEEQFVLAIIDK